MNETALTIALNAICMAKDFSKEAGEPFVKQETIHSNGEVEIQHSSMGYNFKCNKCGYSFYKQFYFHAYLIGHEPELDAIDVISNHICVK